MGLISPTLPTIGQNRGGGEVAVRNVLIALLNEFNGNIDSANIKPGGIATSDLASDVLRIKTYPAVNIATTETRTNTAYGLMTTPDRVQNVVLPTNGLIGVAYQAIWQESVGDAARAALFVGSDQLKSADDDGAAPVVTDAKLNVTAGTDKPLRTYPGGIVTWPSGSTAYTGDVATGQVVGSRAAITGAPSGPHTFAGGICWLFAAAGTYDISVQFKSSSGNVIVKNRKMWVAVMDFS